MEASTSSTGLEGEAPSASTQPPARAQTGWKPFFPMPAQEQWVWLTLGEVMGKAVVAKREIFDPSAAAASAAPLPLTSLVKTGDVCQWEPEEENMADDMDDKDEDEDDMPPTRRLTVLAAEDGTKKGSMVVVLQSCRTCDLLLGLADKAMIALGQWKVLSAKLNRPRAYTPPYAPPPPTTMALTLRVPVRLCVNRATPSLCLQRRKNYLPKLLTLCNTILVAQINKDRHDHGATSASTTLTTRQQQQQHNKPDTGQSRLAQIFEEASKAPQSSHLKQDDHQQRQQQQQQESSRRHLLASAAAKRQQPNAPITLLADDMLGLIFSFFDAMDLERLGDSCHYLSAVTASIIPGLKARLFPHQSRCLEWMLRRETASWRGRQYPDPAWERLEVTVEGEGEEEGEGEVKRVGEDDKRRMDGGWRSIYVNMITGEVLLEGGRVGGRSVPTLTDVRGGFLCDEPGLGKTVTTLALILKTGGRLPGPLDDDQEEEEEEGEAQLGVGGRKSCNSRRRGSERGEGGEAGAGRFYFRSAGKRRREVDPRTLLPTYGTLVISPGHLLQHWREQIERHAEGWALGKDHVFYDDPPGVGGGGGGGRGGGGMKPLPSAEELARYRVVVVTKERLRQEWATGKPESVLDKWAQRYAHHHGDDEDWEGREKGRRLSPLLALRWLRVVVDEGHSLGSVAITNEALMSKGLEAERRWVMTGTPHRHDVADLASLQELLCFMREASFGLSDSKAWGKLISGRSTGAGAMEGMEELRKRRLVTLLRRIMIRHTKEGIPEIPPPKWNVTRLRMSKVEADTYNTLVSLVQANLITTGMVGGTHAPGVGHPDSHLNPVNRRSANTLLSNIRLACCGGGAQIVTLEQAMVVATLKLAREIFLESKRTTGKGGGEGEVDGAVARVATFLRHMRTNLNTPCDLCGTELIILLVTPCLHLVCCRCMKGRNNVCACCGEVFSVDMFQTLQPGLSVHWDESQLNVLPDRVSVGAGEGVEDGGSAGAGACAGTFVATLSPLTQARQPREQANGGHMMTVLKEEEGKVEEEDGMEKDMAVVSDGGQQQQLRKYDADAKYLLPSPHQAMSLTPTATAAAAAAAAAASSFTNIPASERNGAKEGKSDIDTEAPPVHTLPSNSSFASSFSNTTIIWDDGKYSSSSPTSSHPSLKDDISNMKNTNILSEDANGSSRVVSKAWYMITLLRSYLEQQALTPTHTDYRLPLKAVVFSQFRAYLNRLDDALNDQGFRIGKFYEKNRLAELARFKSVEGEGGREGGLQVLLIGKEGSHGLDLSLATHVFLMDEIWDRNLQNQVVSRAYRMGAQASVRVEKLVMQDTVEEVMEALACGKLTSPVGGLDEGEEEEEEGQEMTFGRLGEDAESIASASSFSSSSSSLSAMGAGSWGGGGGQGKKNGRGGRIPMPLVGKPIPWRLKATTAKPVYWLSDQRRQKKNRSRRSGSKAGGAWHGAAEESKLHILLHSLCLVDVDPVSYSITKTSLSSCDTSPGQLSPLVADTDGGDGGSGRTIALGGTVPAASSVEDCGSGGDKNDEMAPPARRVRFM